MGDISAHFNRSEFACRCGCGFDTVDTVLLEKLEIIRNHFDVPIKINSGCRCEAHNKAVGGSKNSKHLYGRAADIVVSGVPSSQVADYAEAISETGGIGRYESFTHIDSRTGTARWDGLAN